MKNISFQITVLGNKKRLSFITETGRHICVAVIHGKQRGIFGVPRNHLKITRGAFFVERRYAIYAFRTCISNIHHKIEALGTCADKSILHSQVDKWSGRVHELHYA
jgi:hypothetical protein